MLSPPALQCGLALPSLQLLSPPDVSFTFTLCFLQLSLLFPVCKHQLDYTLYAAKHTCAFNWQTEAMM